MPILEYHLCEGLHDEARISELLLRSSDLYARVLDSPIERVRVVARLHRPAHFVVGGRALSEGAADAPYFHFLVLAGRPAAQREALQQGFTDLLVSVLGAERGRVRGGCRQIAAEDWSIGGIPASVTRARELAARQAEDRSDPD